MGRYSRRELIKRARNAAREREELLRGRFPEETEPAEQIKTDQRPKSSVKRKLIIVAVVIVALFSTVIYMNEAFLNISWIPKWHHIYEFFGFSKAAYNQISEGEIAVHFIDVDQGDCTLIVAGNKNILIDGGEYAALPKVINYLKSLEIKSLDTVITTHPHSDHIGSLARIIDIFGAKTLIMPKLTENMIPVTSSYVNMLKSADNRGTKLEYAHVGNSIKLTDECFLEVVAPVKDYDDLNNYSLVLKLTYGETSFLFTGDIEQMAERDIYDSGADLSADVIKVAHHGSRSSSLKVFIQAVSPEYAVISVGSPNDYGHPHKETLKLFELLGITIYRTDLDGNIVFVSDGEAMHIEISGKDEAA